MRLIISNVNSPTERIACFLVDEFKDLSAPFTKSLKNVFEFVNLAKTVALKSDEIIVSFDVESLFPNVSIDLALRCAKDWLEENRVAPQKINAYSDMLKLCLNHTFFTFRDKIFQQTEGVAMGSPIYLLG